ncbi:MAG TPA: hypothetical protein VG652_01290 [Gaiellaceae bacterium]|nr:hypothetical protein [Gaiellaceae bacterium]
MKRPPTDFELLKEIYARNRDQFGTYVKGAAGSRLSKIFMPVDIEEIAHHFGVDKDSIFGRLYYHLEPKYGQEPAEVGGPRKAFFSPVLGDGNDSERDCVNFPLLEAVLAGLWQERRRDLWAITTALVSLGIALASLIVSILA